MNGNHGANGVSAVLPVVMELFKDSAEPTTLQYRLGNLVRDKIWKANCVKRIALVDYYDMM